MMLGSQVLRMVPCSPIVTCLFGVACLAQDAGAIVGEVRSHQKISDTAGGFSGILDDADLFGHSVASIGDLDGNGAADIAVGVEGDDDGGTERGAVWILLLNADGTVLGEQKISDTNGGFTGVLDNNDHFGVEVASLGDLDGDDVTDLAVGAALDDDGPGTNRGAVWILFLNSDGTVKSHQKISDTEGGFTAALDDEDRFGRGIAAIGDLDGDGVTELVAGARGDDDGGGERGAVWVLFLNTNGTVASHQKISDLIGGFTGGLSDNDTFGFDVAALGDLDGDGVRDLVVGAPKDDDGGSDRGASWILFLNADATVKSHTKISGTQGGFSGVLDDNDGFGAGVASLGDCNGDNVTDLAVSATLDDDGGPDRGALWFLFLNADGTVRSHRKISDTAGGFVGGLDDGDIFGIGVAVLDKTDFHGAAKVAVAASNDDDGGSNRGAVWILFFGPSVPLLGHRGLAFLAVLLATVSWIVRAQQRARIERKASPAT